MLGEREREQAPSEVADTRQKKIEGGEGGGALFLLDSTKNCAALSLSNAAAPRLLKTPHKLQRDSTPIRLHTPSCLELEARKQKQKLLPSRLSSLLPSFRQPHHPHPPAAPPAAPTTRARGGAPVPRSFNTSPLHRAAGGAMNEAEVRSLVPLLLLLKEQPSFLPNTRARPRRERGSPAPSPQPFWHGPRSRLQARDSMLQVRARLEQLSRSLLSSSSSLCARARGAFSPMPPAPPASQKRNK